jgi:hypothetical protein
MISMPTCPTDPLIAWATFCGGLRMPVYEDRDGGQYVHDDNGEIIRGVWYIPAAAARTLFS